MGLKRYLFSVNLSYNECEDMYLQHIKFLVVTSTSGKRIQLPKQNMQKFVTPAGIQGQFELVVNDNNKIVSVERVK